MAKHVSQSDDQFARQSFSFRRMTSWQLWSLSIASVIVVIGLVAYSITL